MKNNLVHRWIFPLLYGIAAAVLCVLIWGMAEPFWWMGPPLIFGYIGADIARRGSWPALLLCVLPLLVLASVFSIGKPLSAIWVSLPPLALASAFGVWWWERRRPGQPEMAGSTFGIPLILGVAGMVAALFLHLLMVMIGAWPWAGVPPNAVFMPPLLALIAAWLARHPRRKWWLAAIILCLPPLALFVVLPLFQSQPDTGKILDAARGANWLKGSALVSVPMALFAAYFFHQEDTA